MRQRRNENREGKCNRAIEKVSLRGNDDSKIQAAGRKPKVGFYSIVLQVISQPSFKPQLYYYVYKTAIERLLSTWISVQNALHPGILYKGRLLALVES